MKAKHPGSRGRLASLTVSLLTGLTVFFFSPAEIYLHNPLEFQLNAAHALLPMLLTAAAVTAVLFLLLRLIECFSAKAAAAVRCLLFGATLAGYIQMMFCNGNLGQIDGVMQIGDVPDSTVYLNWFLFLALLLLPLILFAATEKKPDSGAGRIIRNKKTLPTLCILLLLMQTGGFASLLPALSEAAKLESRQIYLSYAPAQSLSKEGNIVVFLTDRMEGLWFDEMLERDSSLTERLDGFTFYQNNVSQFTLTYPSAASMFSGIPFAAENASARYLDRVWADEGNLLHRLHDSGWANYYLAEQGATVGALSNISDYTDNIRHTDNVLQYNYCGNGGIIRTETGLSLLRMMPYLLKEIFLVPVNPESFSSFDTEQPDRMPQAITPETDLTFSRYLEAHPLRNDSSRKTASFIHLCCAHDRSAELAALCPANEPGDDSHIAAACGSFAIIAKYLTQMKQAGVYDNSTIIILGDHGRYPSEITRKGQKELDDVIMTTLLVKPAGAAHAPLQTDTEAELSNGFFAASILEYAGLDHSAFGLSYNDVITGHLQPERTLWLNNELTQFYTITGNARDFSNWNYQEASS